MFGKAFGFGSMGGRQVDGPGQAWPPADGFIIQGDADESTGRADSVSGAGDVNGDGYADLIVGAY